MKKILYILFFISSFAKATTYYLVPSGTGIWSSNTNWASSSGGTSGAGVPTSSDAVIFDANSNNTNLTVSSSDAYFLSWSCSSYTGTVTISSSAQIYCYGNITLSSGMSITGGGILGIDAACTLNTNSVVINCSIIYVGAALTLASNITIGALLDITSSAGKISGDTLYCNGGATSSGTPSFGSTVLYFQGTGTIQTLTTNQFSNNITINTTGTITIGSLFSIGAGSTFTYVSGTVVTTGSSFQFGYSGNATVNSNGITWNNIFCYNSCTITLTSALTATGTLSYYGGSIVWAGSYGFTVGSYVDNYITAGSSVTLQAANTYSITTSLTLLGLVGNHGVLKSSSTSTKALFNLQAGASQSVKYITSQYIDSSGGQTIFNNGGVLSNTINWKLGSTGNFFLMFR